MMLVANSNSDWLNTHAWLSIRVCDVFCMSILICHTNLSNEFVIDADWPRDISTLASYKDGYTDILDERRHSSDLAFITRTRVDVPEYKYHVQRTASDIKTHVMNSDRVKYTVERVSWLITITVYYVRNADIKISFEMPKSGPVMPTWKITRWLSPNESAAEYHNRRVDLTTPNHKNC